MKKKTVPATTLGTELDALAMSLAAELRSPETPMDERIGGFKALTAYYAMINKLPQPADDTTGKFGGHSDLVKQSSAKKAVKPIF